MKKGQAYKKCISEGMPERTGCPRVFLFEGVWCGEG